VRSVHLHSQLNHTPKRPHFWVCAWVGELGATLTTSNLQPHHPIQYMNKSLTANIELYVLLCRPPLMKKDCSFCGPTYFYLSFFCLYFPFAPNDFFNFFSYLFIREHYLLLLLVGIIFLFLVDGVVKAKSSQVPNMFLKEFPIAPHFYAIYML
jgi:hypothetical protein